MDIKEKSGWREGRGSRGGGQKFKGIKRLRWFSECGQIFGFFVFGIVDFVYLCNANVTMDENIGSLFCPWIGIRPGLSYASTVSFHRLVIDLNMCEKSRAASAKP
jgi:hypothetical protein